MFQLVPTTGVSQGTTKSLPIAIRMHRCVLHQTDRIPPAMARFDPMDCRPGFGTGRCHDIGSASQS